MLSEGCFVVTGGARGITAACTLALAKQVGGRYLLLGRTPLTEEPLDNGGSEKELQLQVLADLRAKDQKVSPVRVKQTVERLLAQREIRATLAALAQVGALAEYRAVDAANADEVRSALASTSLGAVRGVVHGAGVLADGLVETRTDQDWQRVLATKVTGLENLLDAVDRDRLEVLSVFSSVSAFSGNAGQTLYALANEILNKMALGFARRNPHCRVTSFNWGPWEGGMVTPLLRDHFRRLGVPLLPLDQGAALFAQELTGTRTKVVRLVVGSSLPFSPPPGGPLTTRRVTRRWTLDTAPFLLDHVIDGTPVLPATCALGWLEQAALAGFPGMLVGRVVGFQVLKGLVFDADLAESYTVELAEFEKTFDTVTIKATATSQVSGRTRYHYRAEVTLVRRLPEAAFVTNLVLAALSPWTELRPYEDGSLFHGPRFQSIRRVLNVSDSRLTAECVLPEVSESDRGPLARAPFDPLGRDVLSQCVGLWAFHARSAIGLPLGYGKVEYYRDFPKAQPFYVTVRLEQASSWGILASVFASDALGALYCKAEHVELTLSPRLSQAASLPRSVTPDV